MQIILLEKIVNVGNLGDVVKVKHGYARNYLIPQGKAKRATAENIKVIETRRAELEKVAADKLAAAQTQAAKLEGLTIQISQKAGVDGRLFGSVTNVDIVESLKAQGFTVEKADIRMPAGPSEAGRRSSAGGGAPYRSRRQHHGDRHRGADGVVVRLPPRRTKKGPCSAPFSFRVLRQFERGTVAHDARDWPMHAESAVRDSTSRKPVMNRFIATIVRVYPPWKRRCVSRRRASATAGMATPSWSTRPSCVSSQSMCSSSDSRISREDRG